ncbi:MAG: hypothetical protein FJ279_00445 [Planctomycetes bacterium]|nr:hypothetical protein [Planctomycetota bacterium]
MTKTEKAPPNPFRTVDASGKPVARRFSDATALRAIYKTLQEQDERGESQRRAKIRRMYEFHRPWDPKKLEAAGVKDMANINCGGLAGQVDARAGAISDMALDTTDLVELRALPAELAGPDAEAIGSVVAEEFSTVLREGRGFLSAVATMVREADLYGLGPVSWRDPFDYQPIALERGQVKFPSDASSISSENELLMVETVLPAWYLFQLFDDPAASESAGWTLSVVKQYLVAVFSAGGDTETQARDTTGTSVEESILAEWRQNRLLETKQFETIRVISAYVREVSGDRKVSHYMVPATEAGQKDVDGFLFLQENAFDTMDQCLLWLPYSATEKYARSQRGLASKILPTEDLRNRMVCKIADAASRAASIQLEAGTSGEAVRNTVVEQGPYTFYTGGVRPVTAKTAPDFSGLAAVHEMLGRVTSNNVNGAQGAGAAPERVYAGADRKTKEQVRQEGEAGAKAEQALFVMRSVVFDSLFRECFRRFMKLVASETDRGRYAGVQAFIDKCDRRGVPLATLRKVPTLFSIYMCRDLVTGGAGAKAGVLYDVLSTLGGNLDEKGRINCTRDYVRARAGRAAADRYRPDVGRDAMPGDAASHAVMENNDLMEGAAVLVGTDQLHWSHIPVHNQILEQIAQAVQAGQVEDPAAMLKTLQMTTEHIEGHAEIGGMQVGKAAHGKAVIQSLRSLRPVGQALTMMVQTQEHEQEAEARKQQQAQEELQRRADGQDAQAAMHDSDNKAAVKMYEVDRMAEVRMADAQSKAQTAAFQARSKASIDRISARYRMLTQGGAMGVRPPNTASMAGEGGEEELAGTGLF